MLWLAGKRTTGDSRLRVVEVAVHVARRVPGDGQRVAAAVHGECGGVGQGENSPSIVATAGCGAPGYKCQSHVDEPDVAMEVVICVDVGEFGGHLPRELVSPDDVAAVAAAPGSFPGPDEGATVVAGRQGWQGVWGVHRLGCGCTGNVPCSRIKEGAKGDFVRLRQPSTPCKVHGMAGLHGRGVGLSEEGPVVRPFTGEAGCPCGVHARTHAMQGFDVAIRATPQRSLLCIVLVDASSALVLLLWWQGLPAAREVGDHDPQGRRPLQVPHVGLLEFGRTWGLPPGDRLEPLPDVIKVHIHQGPSRWRGGGCNPPWEGPRHRR